MQLEEALWLIKSYQNKLGYTFKYDSTEERMEHIRNLALAQNVEVSEFLEWLPYKAWRNIEDQPYNIPEAALELIDQFFFLADMWLALGLSPKDFEPLFKKKLTENISRISRGYNNTSEQRELQFGNSKGETL